MSKGGGSSWFDVVKRAFRFPSKESEQRSFRSKEDHEQEEEDKRRGKLRWIFGKAVSNKTALVQHQVAKPTCSTAAATDDSDINCIVTRATEMASDEAERRHAIAVAMAATEAAVATAQAAVEFIRLTRPCVLVREQRAATVIQKAFRGYLVCEDVYRGVILVLAFF
ncbi:hypothetical protein Ancab_008988 [Ancistrocladus abbreviatus]